MKILAVDFGDARTGLAVSDIGEQLASPVGILHEKNRDRLLLKIADRQRALGAGLLVVGDPLNMDGTAGPRSRIARRLAEDLSSLVGCPVRLWDERSTTVTAAKILNEANVRGEKRKARLDALAAAVILESYLAYRKNHPEEN